MDFKRGSFRVRGDVLEIYPAYSGGDAYRVEFFGDEVERITEIDSLTGEGKAELGHIAIFPASTTWFQRKDGACDSDDSCGAEGAGGLF